MKKLNNLVKQTIKRETKSKSTNVFNAMKKYNDLKDRGLIKDDKYNLITIGTTGTKNLYNINN